MSLPVVYNINIDYSACVARNFGKPYSEGIEKFAFKKYIYIAFIGGLLGSVYPTGVCRRRCLC